MLLRKYYNSIYLHFLRVQDVCQEAIDINSFLELLYMFWFFILVPQRAAPYFILEWLPIFNFFMANIILLDKEEISDLKYAWL